MPFASRTAAERARKRKRGKHKPPGYRKKTARAVRRGKQQTLKPCKPCHKQPLPRLLTPGEAEYLYNQALAEIWGVPMERIRTRSWVLPEITYFN